MQRWFSSFPQGWPGLGLLLLRAAVAVSLVAHGVASLAGKEQGRWALMVGLAAMVAGAALLIGFLTPPAALLAGAVSIGMALPSFIPNAFGGAPATIFLIVMATAVLLLGPGAFSLDARLFGRREIFIPQGSKSIGATQDPADS